MTKIKLWISDIDGTILNYDGSCTKKMQEVIKKINNSDTKLVLATGRMFMGAQYTAEKFNLKTPVVCYQGAVIRTKDEILFERPVKIDLVKEIIAYLRNKKIHTHIYNDDILYIEDDNKRIMHDYCNNRGTTYKTVKSFDDIELSSVSKVLAVIEDDKLMEEVKDELAKKYFGILNIVKSAKTYLEITDIEATKGNALKFLKEYWSLKDEEVIASGDQDNDIDLLLNAGIKVAVGSNSNELNKIAQYRFKSVNSDQLPKLIERLVLCE